MKKLPDATVIFAVAVALTCGGCSAVSSTARRATVVGAGSAVGAAAGYAAGNRKPELAFAGAAVGAAATHAALGEDSDVLQRGFDQGYVQGQSDSIKRQYFLRQALEAKPLPGASAAGETVYYVLPGPEVTTDGRKLEPHQVAVRVVE